MEVSTLLVNMGVVHLSKREYILVSFSILTHTEREKKTTKTTRQRTKQTRREEENRWQKGGNWFDGDTLFIIFKSFQIEFNKQRDKRELKNQTRNRIELSNKQNVFNSDWKMQKKNFPLHFQFVFVIWENWVFLLQRSTLTWLRFIEFVVNRKKLFNVMKKLFRYWKNWKIKLKIRWRFKVRPLNKKLKTNSKQIEMSRVRNRTSYHHKL